MKEKIQDLIERKKRIEAGDGEGIEEQHGLGKLTARERINLLLDEGSFVETDQFISHRSRGFGMEDLEAGGDGVVTGYGTVDGRLVYLYAMDFSLMRGSLGEMNSSKIIRVQDMALKMGAPIVALTDTGGARLEEGLDGLAGYGKILYRQTRSSGVIPQISGVYGQTAGLAANIVAMSDFSFMVDKTSRVYSIGPEVIKTVTGQEISEEDLGGARVNGEKTGLGDFIHISEEESIEGIRELLSFLPSNNLEDPPAYTCKDDLNRVEDGLNKIIAKGGKSSYDMRELVGLIADEGYFYEVKKSYAANLIVGFIRLNGKTIGLVANQPKELAGCLDIDGSDKGAGFVRYCDAFNIPLLTLVDVAGYLPGLDQEHGGLVRHGAKLIYAYSEANVAKVSLVVGKAYGGAYLAMCSKELGADQVFAWPGAEIAVMGPDGAANILYGEDIARADDPVARREELIAYYRDEEASPYVAAKRGYVDDVIVPSISRPKLISAFDMLESKRESGPSKKHGNIPL